MNQREPGFYWVKISNKWTIAEWYRFDDGRSEWYIIANDCTFMEMEFDSIDENRIPNYEEKQ